MATLDIIDSAFVLGGSAQYAVAFDHGPGGATLTPVTIAGTVQALAPTWWLLCPSNAALNCPIVPKDVKRNEDIMSITVDRPGGKIIASTPPLGNHFNMQVWNREGRAERDKIMAILHSGLTMRLVSILNEAWYVRLANGTEATMQQWAPLPGEVTALRDAHVIGFALDEVIFRG